jgi:peptide/nickel transport system permease protein
MIAFALRRSAEGRVTRQSEVYCGIAILAVVIALVIAVPILSPYSVDELAAAPFESPSMSHPFGTDSLGRDLFFRTFAAGRIDLLVAVVVVTWSMLIGTTVGILMVASERRSVDRGLTLVTDAIIAFPFIILILALVVVIGPERSIGFVPSGLPATVAAFLIAGWAYYARLVRGEALALRGREYIVATRVLGYSQWRVIRRHYFPRVVRVAAAYAVADAIAIVVVVASLAFLGAGVQPPTPEWGGLMYDGRSFLQTAWWMTVMPGLVLAFTALGFTLVADAVLRRTA